MNKTISTFGIFKTQFKRELWEHRKGFFYAPLFISFLSLAIVVCGFIYTQKHINQMGENVAQVNGKNIEGAKSNDNAKSNFGFDFSFNFGNGKSNSIRINNADLPSAAKKDATLSWAPMMMAMGINSALSTVVLFVILLVYSGTCLFDDRKNRDILFWRSMPISETINVWVKLLVIVSVAPVVILITSLVVGLITFIPNLVFAIANGATLGNMFRFLPIGPVSEAAFKMFGFYVAMLLVISPIYCFNLFCSSLAKRSPFLTGAIIPIVLIALDKMSQILIGVNLRVIDLFETYGKAVGKVAVAFSTSNYNILDANTLIIISTSVVAGVGFLMVAIWLRNNRYEI